MHKLAFLNRYGYSHDIFVSYSQGDVSGGGRSLLCDWSHQMADLLEKNVEAILRKPVAIFLDTDPREEAGVDPLDHLSNQLPQAIKGSALLKVLMSPHYLDSDWCKLELR